MTFYHVNGTKIEVIGKLKNYQVTYAIIYDNISSYIGACFILNNKGLTPSPTELNCHLRSYRAFDLLKRLSNPKYLKNKNDFINMIRHCYDLNDTEQRLLKMYSVKEQ
jgi:hypothetical protein